MIGSDALTREDLVMTIDEQSKIIKGMTDRAINPPIIFKTNDKEYERRSKETISKLEMETINLEEEIKRLEEIVLERELWRRK